MYIPKYSLREIHGACLSGGESASHTSSADKPARSELELRHLCKISTQSGLKVQYIYNSTQLKDPNKNNIHSCSLLRLRLQIASKLTTYTVHKLLAYCLKECMFFSVFSRLNFRSKNKW